MTVKQAHEAIARNNFYQAREMLCIKMGWTRELHMYVKRPDSDVDQKAVKEFIRKVTRVLAYNYDVHRRPSPALFPTLWPSDKPGSQPVRLPPEFRNENNPDN